MPKKIIFVNILFIIIFFSLSPLLADLSTKSYPSINIESDNLSYSENKRFLEASGNVKAFYKEYIISSNYLKVDLEKQEAIFKGGFSMVRSNRAINGEELQYDLSKQKGFAKNVVLSFGNLHIKGASLKVDSKKIYLYKTTLTTCSLSEPHYQISALNTTLHLKLGLLVSDNSIFSLYGVPVMYIPNYIYRLGEDEGTSPLPRIGSDSVNGKYIKENIGYYLNENNTGVINLELYEKKGWRYGVKNNYTCDNNSFGNFRMHHHQEDGIEGGWVHNFFIRKDDSKKEYSNIIEEFFYKTPLNYNPFLKVEFEVSFGEVFPGDRDQQRVSFLPQVTLLFPKNKSIFFSNLNYSLTTKLGNIIEENSKQPENSVARRRFFIELDYYLDLSLWKDLAVRFSPSYQGAWYWDDYGLTDSWNLINASLTLKKDINPFSFEVSYFHNFINNGNSAFSFDSKDAVINDELIYKSAFEIANYELGGTWRYDLSEKYYKDIDIDLKILMHCWKLVLTWRETRNIFQFGIVLN